MSPGTRRPARFLSQAARSAGPGTWHAGHQYAVLFRSPSLDAEPSVGKRMDDLDDLIVAAVEGAQREGVLRQDRPVWWFVSSLYALVYVAWEGIAKGKLARCFVVFGRVPLFYYVAHLLLIHSMAVVFAAATNGHVAWLLGGLPIEAKPEGYGLSLPGVYLTWLIVVAALYLPCRWFAEVKRRSTAGWLSYL